MHFSPCVVSVTAAAAADFPGFPNPSTAADLSQQTSEGQHHIIINSIRQYISPGSERRRGLYIWISGGRLWRRSWSIHRIQLPHGLGLVSVGLCQVL